MIVRRVLRTGLLAALTSVSLVACGAQESGQSTARQEPQVTASAPATAPVSGPAAAGAVLSVVDPWVKTTKKGMTAAFGTLVNNTDAEVTVVSGSTPLSPKVELHEVVESGGKMVMQPKQSGFVIPARGTHRLQPGGDHIMLMGVTEEVKPGAQVAFTLTLKDGKTLEFTAVGKDFAGGKEDYQPGHGTGGENEGGHEGNG
ncbi:hypothetical protein FHS43_001459 [Streptosporangium becharense]|uniref:Copper(I)-binding protein n=1 Tax=Streptosporangium becharense TaxID=1816182 RepID=A0A7W9IMU6_9ACTN|nr:copper chaperone PCu(A)C [Streptosporangium becharense]MBB2910196.1 hypothetical protein [Streptosporangium becharense]MBB5822939.1 copper(I)-binding protein [Streptosporangium becharense]